jgi:hypothetical protein
MFKPSFSHACIVALIGLSLVGCSSAVINTCCIPECHLPSFKTVQIVGASSALRGRPMGDDLALKQHLASEITRAFPGVKITEGDADIQLILVVVDYVPGCLPNCRKFPTYLNWSAEVMTWHLSCRGAQGTQVVAFEGQTWNPAFDPAAEFAIRIKKHWAQRVAPPNSPLHLSRRR